MRVGTLESVLDTLKAADSAERQALIALNNGDKLKADERMESVMYLNKVLKDEVRLYFKKVFGYSNKTLKVL